MDKEQVWTRIVAQASKLKEKVDAGSGNDKVWIHPVEEDEPTISFRVDRHAVPPKMVWLNVRIRDGEELTLVATTISFVDALKTVSPDAVYIVDVTPDDKINFLREWNVLQEFEIADYFLRQAFEQLERL